MVADEGDLGPDADAEPDDEQRREGDLGDAVKGEEIGLDDPGGAGMAAEGVASEASAEDRAQAVAEGTSSSPVVTARLGQDLAGDEQVDEARGDGGRAADIGLADSGGRRRTCQNNRKSTPGSRRRAAWLSLLPTVPVSGGALECAAAKTVPLMRRCGWRVRRGRLARPGRTPPRSPATVNGSNTLRGRGSAMATWARLAGRAGG